MRLKLRFLISFVKFQIKFLLRKIPLFRRLKNKLDRYFIDYNQQILESVLTKKTELKNGLGQILKNKAIEADEFLNQHFDSINYYYVNHCFKKFRSCYFSNSNEFSIIPVINHLLESKDDSLSEQDIPELSTSEEKLKILFVCGMFPSVTHAGGLRVFDIINELSQNAEITIYAIYNKNEDKESYEYLKGKVKEIKLVSHIHYLSDKACFKKWLTKKDQKFDIAQFEYPQFIHEVEYTKNFAKAVGYTYMESLTLSSLIDVKQSLKENNVKEFAENLASYVTFAKVESDLIKECDFTIALTKEDARSIGEYAGKLPYIVSTGVSSYEVLSKREKVLKVKPEYTCAFMGYFNHLPNVEAMTWYFNEVHPILKNSNSDYKVIVVGAGNSKPLKDLVGNDSSVHFTGRVEDITEFIVKGKICISPLISGAGFRGKINQYSALARPTVSTTIGVKGMPYIDKESVLIGDDAQSFAKAIISLDSDEALYKSVQEKSMKVVDDNFSWEAKCKELKALYYHFLK